MPGLDGTGPQGQGPMSGRGAGKCPICGNNYNKEGRGRGFGMKRFWSAPNKTLQELKAVETQLEQELKDLKAEIASKEK